MQCRISQDIAPTDETQRPTTKANLNLQNIIQKISNELSTSNPRSSQILVNFFGLTNATMHPGSQRQLNSVM